MAASGVELSGVGIAIAAEELVGKSALGGLNGMARFTRRFEEVALLPACPFDVDTSGGSGSFSASESELTSMISSRKGDVFCFLDSRCFEVSV
jgi:hypothetical protein